MSIKVFKLVFDNPSKTFRSGQSVTGKLLLTVSSPKKIRGIVMHFKGEASTKWDVMKETKNAEGNTVYTTVENTGHELYFENKFNLVGGPSGETTMQSGEYCYPFNTVLPPNLPSSFEGKLGEVCYTIKATIDCPWESNSETLEKFTVLCPFDLKMHETAKDPVKVTEEHYFCCCCCQSGPLTMVASLPASGFVCGQEIPVTVEVDNISEEEISRVRATLRQFVTFHATSPNKLENSEHINVKAIDLGSVGMNGSETWTKSILIPSLPASNLNHCSLIDIKYELKIVAEVAGMCSSDVTIKIPLTIGTIPLDGVTVAGDFVTDDIGSDSNVMIPGNVNAVDAVPGHVMAPQPIGFQVPTGGTWGMPMPGPVQPTFFPPPFNPNQGMQSNVGMQPSMVMHPSMGMQPNMGMQHNMGMQPNMGMQHNMRMQPNVGMQSSAVVTQPQMSYNPYIGGYVQQNTAMQPPQNMPYPGVPTLGVYGQQSTSYANVSPSTFGRKNFKDDSEGNHEQGNPDFIPRSAENSFQNASAPNQ